MLLYLDIFLLFLHKKISALFIIQLFVVVWWAFSNSESESFLRCCVNKKLVKVKWISLSFVPEHYKRDCVVSDEWQRGWRDDPRGHGHIIVLAGSFQRCSSIISSKNGSDLSVHDHRRPTAKPERLDRYLQGM